MLLSVTRLVSMQYFQFSNGKLNREQGKRKAFCKSRNSAFILLWCLNTLNTVKNRVESLFLA